MNKAFWGFITGAAVGGLVGILFAPDKGSQTRKRFVKKTDEVTDSVKDTFSEVPDLVKSTYSGIVGESKNKGISPTNPTSPSPDVKKAF